MIEEVKQSLLEECELTAAQPVIIGVSGGADSRCLLDICVRLGYAPVVAHLDHAIRKESQEEVRFVRDLAQEAGLEFVTQRVSVPSLAARQRLSVEAAARHARYQFMFGEAEVRGAAAVLVAHTADDQAETVLLHLLRGSGVAGLQGMRARTILPGWHASIPLARPLLGIWGEQTRAYCAERGLTWIEDPSNTDPKHLRNRVRHELIPILETYNPAMRKSLWRLAVAARGEVALAERAYAEIEQDLVSREEPEAMRLNQEALLPFDPAVRRSLIFRILGQMSVSGPWVDLETVERVVDFGARSEGSIQQDLGHGLRLRRDGGDILLERKDRQAPTSDQWLQVLSPEPTPLPVPGSVPLKNGWRLVSLKAPAATVGGPGTAGSVPRFWAEVDADRLTGRLIVRPRREGDRIRPLGMAGRSQKVSDVMINAKMPREARDSWPLVAAGEEIVWIPGYRLGDGFRTSGETRGIIRFVIEVGKDTGK